MPDLKEHFLSLPVASATVQLKWWKLIVQYYGESQRHYHTVRHIECLHELLLEYHPELKQESAEWAVMLLSIIFHDIIYDPKASDNEEKSVDLFLEYCSECSQSMISKVQENVVIFIRATIKHALSCPLVDGLATKWAYEFLDFDLQVLAWPALQYDIYSKQIRQEYHHYPDDAYYKGRIQVLQKFLTTIPIYHIHPEWQPQAIENIQREIGNLKIL